MNKKQLLKQKIEEMRLKKELEEEKLKQKLAEKRKKIKIEEEKLKKELELLEKEENEKLGKLLRESYHKNFMNIEEVKQKTREILRNNF